MGSGHPVPCRDFAAGRCQRGSDCRFLHEDSSRRQPNRYYDSGISDGRESRAERGRINVREPQNYPRDRFSRSDSRTTRCYDFMMGRCRRGSECRYAHHEASHDRERDVRDEPRARTHDRRDDERLDPPHRPVTDTPCKFFAEGCCRRGEGCRFSHHGVEAHDDTSYSMDIDVRNSSRNNRNQEDHSAVIEITKSSKWMGNDNCSKVEDSKSKPQHSQTQFTASNIHQNQPQKASNPLPVASIPGQNLGQVGQNQYSSGQPIQAQGFIPNVPFQQLLPPMPLNVQMQQAAFSTPQNVQGGQFIVPQAPPNFSVPMQNLPVLPPSNITMGQQNYNLPLPPHTGQNQQNFNLIGQIQQNLPLAPLSGRNQLNLNFSGQNQHVASQSLSPENFNSNEQLIKRADTSEQPSQLNSDASITQKVVTSEQAAQITNLSASLAHFFGGTGGLKPQISTGMLPLVQPNQGSFTNPISGNMELVDQDTSNLPADVEQKGHAVEEGVTNTNSTIPPIKSVDVEIEVMQGIVDTAAKEVNEAEAVHNKKERVDDIEAEVQKDGESKQSKEAKGMRMFKCALVEFVKEVLKPSWKEGHLSKEAHKTIVKKAVEKVTGAMQSQNIPQTQEKIDIYLAHSKAKLTKLVQAYVDKYVKG
ncbi:uncharacterized protein A4U43_C06F1980 [Asparagus officinalis]|uniref:C3H1-type domain-containing protein n=2 Tax=Asparagus officinalis TaxID=4686 RepID=A0A5P1EIU8_ASPOF|nr:uncharacterized protein A4U43_C06F1980 [Asparagus officinalis]